MTTNTTLTIAETLASLRDDCGQTWQDAQGVEMDDAADLLAVSADRSLINDATVYTFEDDSMIVTGGQYWDILTFSAGAYYNSNGDRMTLRNAEDCW